MALAAHGRTGSRAEEWILTLVENAESGVVRPVEGLEKEWLAVQDENRDGVAAAKETMQEERGKGSATRTGGGAGEDWLARD